jgi:hypothetical protein
MLHFQIKRPGEQLGQAAWRERDGDPIHYKADVTAELPTRIRVGVFILFHLYALNGARRRTRIWCASS